MKKPILLLIMLSTAIYLWSCSSDDNGNSNDNNEQISQIEAIVESGSWRITSYIDSGDNETSDFNGYDFTFNSDGTLVATNGSDTLNGTWSITESSRSTSDDLDFNIFFPVSETSDFEDLNDDWDIISTSETKIDLIDVSGGNGGTDTLTFEKN